MSSGGEVAEPPPVRGLLRTTWDQRSHVLNWDLALAALLTAVGVLFVKSSVIHDVLNGLLTAEFGLIGAVLGVVIAGVAIIVAFLTRDYAEVLMRSEGGPIGDFWPFWFVAGLAASAVVTAGVGLVVIDQRPSLQRTVFGVTTFLSTYAVFATVNLVAFVAQQGVTRSWQLTRREQSG